MAELNNFIEWFHGDEEDYKKLLKVFRSTRNFLTFLLRNNKLGTIDYTYIPDYEFINDPKLFEFLSDNNLISLDNISSTYNNIEEFIKNNLLLYYLDSNYADAMSFITEELITDVIYRNDGFYLKLRDRSELAEFFCSRGRGDVGAVDVAKQILNDEGLGHDWHFDYDRNVDDTIDELDDSNLSSLGDLIFKEIGNVELSLEDYDSDFFQNLSEEQGTEGYFMLRSEDIKSLLSDDDAINEICSKDLDDLGGNLRNLYWNAENIAYEDELYDLVYDGLNLYFVGRIDEVPYKVGDKTKYNLFMKIRDFEGDIRKFLNNNTGSVYNDSFLEYFGSYTELFKGLIYNDEAECIDFSIPDYPDYRRTQKNINQMFNDYI
jgi:hypothetical protein